jgi:hypothetical protein
VPADVEAEVNDTRDVEKVKTWHGRNATAEAPASVGTTA